MAKIAIVKKTKGSFKRHHHDRYARLSRSSHRHQRGIDSCVRRRYRGKAAQPKIGYGSNKKTKHLMPNGYRRLVVSNSKDVELLLMHNASFAAEIAHNVSSRKRIEILEKAKVLGVKVTNANAKLRAEEA